MAKVVAFESNEDKLNRLKETHLDKCDELDKALNQMELKYKYRTPDENGNIKGDLNDVDMILGMMTNVTNAKNDITSQKCKMGLSKETN